MIGIEPKKQLYKVTLCNGKIEIVESMALTYDIANNLNFYDIKQSIKTHENPEGIDTILVKAFNSRHYESYEMAPTIQ